MKDWSIVIGTGRGGGTGIPCWCRTSLSTKIGSAGLDVVVTRLLREDSISIKGSCAGLLYCFKSIVSVAGEDKSFVKGLLFDRSIGSQYEYWSLWRVAVAVQDRWELTQRGYCAGAGQMSCLLLSGQATIYLITIEN